MGKSTIGKYQVAIKSLRLDFVNFDSDKKDLLLMIDVAWKVQIQRSTSLLMPQFPRRKTRRECTKKKKKNISVGIANTGAVFEWDDEFENTCDFSVDSKADGSLSFLPWNVCFRVLQGIGESEKATVMGKVLLNIAEIAGKMESSSVERKIPISLQVAGNTVEAYISVTLSFVEVRICAEPEQLSANSADSDGWLRIARALGIRRGRKKHRQTQSNPDSGNSTELESSSSDTGFDPSKRPSKGFWKKRRLSFSSARVKTEPPLLDTTSTSCSEPTTLSPGTCSLPCSPSNWEEKELVSRDGKSKLQTNVFLASFDQRSKEANGEGACAALVAVFAHWLHSNTSEIPTRHEFDNLIKDGSTEWRRLLETNNYTEKFSNGHFDLETILEANIRPLSVQLDKSFTGFFIPERFDSLEGAMSFDEIWDRVKTEPESEFIYIVSWNDHFFLMMAKEGSYYIVDSLGERLFEGCNQGFILKFDESSFVASENGEVICSGIDCCREFIKRFLASVTLEETEEDKKRLGSEAIPVVSLHRKLQIEFHYTSVKSSSVDAVVSSSTCAMSSDDQIVPLGGGNGSTVLGLG